MNKINNSKDISLLKFQLGPVQDFIAAARSTRDLWSGSYLLSWLMAEGIKALDSDASEIIFPCVENQPLLSNRPDWNSLDKATKDKLRIPNLPNIFVVKVQTEHAQASAAAVEKAIRKCWKEIGDSVWNIAGKLGIDSAYQDRFHQQIEDFLSIAWQITPLHDDGYSEAYRSNGWHLNATRQLHHFQAPVKTSGISNEKDSLTGTLEEIKLNHQNISTHYKHLFKHADDHLSAISLVKRLWHLTYLGKEGRPNADHKEFKIPSTPDLAARNLKQDESESSPAEDTTIEKYLAAIAFDGDSIGKWMGGKFHDDSELEGFHRDFSQALSQFALDKVPEIITGNDGFLIYAGGDDVLALVPADTALDCAEELRDAFRASTKEVAPAGNQPDASVGIAIAHVKSPLQDLVKEAIHAEKRAKSRFQRSAFCINLMKRSGETNQWGGNWDNKSLPLFNTISTDISDGKLSNRFTSRVCQLLAPYQSTPGQLNNEKHGSIDHQIGQELIVKEVTFSAQQQGSTDFAKELSLLLEPHLQWIQNSDKIDTDDKFQYQLKSIIGLCQTIAFTLRNKN